MNPSVADVGQGASITGVGLEVPAERIAEICRRYGVQELALVRGVRIVHPS